MGAGETLAHRGAGKEDAASTLCLCCRGGSPRRRQRAWGMKVAARAPIIMVVAFVFA